MLFLDQNVSQLNMCTSCVFKTKLCTFPPSPWSFFMSIAFLRLVGCCLAASGLRGKKFTVGHSVCVCVCMLVCMRFTDSLVWQPVLCLTVLNNGSKLLVSEVFMWATTTVPVPSWIWFILCDSWGFWSLLLQATGSERKVLWNWKVVICFVSALGCSGKWNFRNLWVCLVC